MAENDSKGKQPRLTPEDAARIRAKANEILNRESQLTALESALGVDDPIVHEVIESLRREIEKKDELLVFLHQELERLRGE